VRECQECHRVFDSDRSFDLHLSYDVKSSMVVGPEDAAVRFPERARCGNHQELLGKGLTWHGWLSVSGWKDDWWSATTG
jgi:hypothetical protein